MIKTFEYHLDTDNWEIFPKDIWADPYVVFHGTSSFHSDSIEQSGWVKGHSPYDIEDAIELVRVLELPLVKTFDIATVWDLTTAKTLRSYIAANQIDQFRLSFSYLSSLCVLFSTGKSKGGQTLGNVREAKNIIETAIASNPSLQGILTEPINRLYSLADEVESANGVVYAIKLPTALEGITEEHGVIHSDLSISKELILGKVILPNTIDLNILDRAVLKARNKAKLLEIGNLGVTLGQRNNN